MLVWTPPKARIKRRTSHEQNQIQPIILGSCEVRRFIQLSSTDFIWSGWGVLHASPAVKNAEDRL